MKIQDIIKFEKKIAIKRKSYRGTLFFFENQTELKYQKKNGYYWKIPSHSRYESLFLNNYEKDCVIAYMENSYFIMFLMKSRGKENNKVFRYFKPLIKGMVMGCYPLDEVFNKNKFLEIEKVEKVNICDENEYSRFKKLLILKELEE